MNKNRLFFLFCFFAVLLMLCCGCKGKEVYSADEIYTSLLENFSGSDKMVSLSAAQIENYFFIKEGQYSEARASISATEENFDTLAVFSFTNSDSRNTVLDGIKSYATAVSSSHQTLEKTNSDKLLSRLVYETDDCIILVICDNYKTPKEYLDSIGAKPVK